MTELYRLYDVDGALLWVGISDSAQARIEHHRYRAFWGREIAQVVRKTYPTRACAAHVEKRAIRILRPRHNVQHQRDWQARIGKPKPPRRSAYEEAMQKLRDFWSGLSPEEVAEIEDWCSQRERERS